MISPFSANSHRGFLLESIDARLRMIGLLIGMALVFLAANWFQLLPALVLVIILQVSAWSGWKDLLRVLSSFWLFFGIVFLIHAFTTEGEEIFRLTRLFSVTNAGMKSGIFFCGKIALLVMSFRPILTATHPGDLMKIFEANISPDDAIFLTRLKRFWNRGSLTFGLAVRFIPIIFEEAQRIRQAQISRSGQEQNSRIAVLKNVPQLLVPLVNSIFRRADQITFAMQSRAFSINGFRTPCLQKGFRRLDYFALIILMIISCAGYIVILK